MVSPELLRRYPFFSFMNENQLKIVAMNTEEEAIEHGVTLYQEGQATDNLYFLLEGSIDLYNLVEEAYRPELSREFLVGDINPGEPFDISVCIEPNLATTTARAAKNCRMLKIKADALHHLCQEDKEFGYKLMCQLARIAVERLHATRLQLAAAWA